jgi:hypothetical protein
MNLNIGQTVTTSQVGVANVITGTFAGIEGSFALVVWTTATGRTVTGRFPLAATQAA